MALEYQTKEYLECNKLLVIEFGAHPNDITNTIFHAAHQNNYVIEYILQYNSNHNFVLGNLQAKNSQG